jgi:phage gpG-like protein
MRGGGRRSMAQLPASSVDLAVAMVARSLGRARRSQPRVSPSAGDNWALVGQREHLGHNLGGSGEGRAGWVLWTFRLRM